MIEPVMWRLAAESGRTIYHIAKAGPSYLTVQRRADGTWTWDTRRGAFHAGGTAVSWRKARYWAEWTHAAFADA